MIITIAIICIILFLVLILGLFIIFYNKFQVLRNGAEAGLSQIKVALKKRLDMISQLVEVVKSYTKFEKEVFEKIAEMRSQVGQLKNIEDIDKINNQSKKILNNLIAVVENYPNLKASQNVMDLMNSIKDVEDEIARQRYTYNNIVQEYNTKLGTIPSNIIAKIFSYNKLEYLQFEEESNSRPKTG